ncbi:MAG TPA: hypothetical protein VGF59_31605 [Bryobacteraceae bacterium]|jgi:hypothetical protein
MVLGVGLTAVALVALHSAWREWKRRRIEARVCRDVVDVLKTMPPLVETLLDVLPAPAAAGPAALDRPADLKWLTAAAPPPPAYATAALMPAVAMPPPLPAKPPADAGAESQTVAAKLAHASATVG